MDRRDFAAAAGLGAAAWWLADPPGARAALPEAVDWTSVKDYGARGDGRTDDTEAIQRALSGQVGGVVYFPSGVYPVTRTLVSRTPVSIVGGATRSTILESRVPDGGALLEIGFPDWSEEIRGIRVANLFVRSRSAGGGIRLHAVYDSSFENLRLDGLGWGIEGNRAISVQFDNLFIRGMQRSGGGTGEGVYLYGQSNGTLFNKFRGAENDGPAFRLGYGQNCTLVNPVIEGHDSPPIVIGRQQDGTYVNCRAVTLLNPYFEANSPYDVLFLRGGPFTVIGGYWGPQRPDYLAPFQYHQPFTAIGSNFPNAPRGAVHVPGASASVLLVGCGFAGEPAVFDRTPDCGAGGVRVIDADRDYRVGCGETALPTARPASPRVGQGYFDTALGRPLWYDGGGWVDGAGGRSP